MIAAYRLLLKLYPHRRDNFADEMLEVFAEAEAEASRKTIDERAAFYLREVFGFAVGALRERSRRIGCHSWQSKELNTGGVMILKTRCRFPRSAIAMMTFVLIITVGMIAKIQGVSHLNANFTGSLPEQPWRWPSYYGLISGIVVAFVATWIVGAAVWALAYALRRSPAQQLGNFEAWPHGRS